MNVCTKRPALSSRRRARRTKLAAGGSGTQEKQIKRQRVAALEARRWPSSWRTKPGREIDTDFLWQCCADAEFVSPTWRANIAASHALEAGILIKLQSRRCTSTAGQGPVSGGTRRHAQGGARERGKKGCRRSNRSWRTNCSAARPRRCARYCRSCSTSRSQSHQDKAWKWLRSERAVGGEAVRARRRLPSSTTTIWGVSVRVLPATAGFDSMRRTNRPACPGRRRGVHLDDASTRKSTTPFPDAAGNGRYPSAFTSPPGAGFVPVRLDEIARAPFHCLHTGAEDTMLPPR